MKPTRKKRGINGGATCGKGRLEMRREKNHLLKTSNADRHDGQEGDGIVDTLQRYFKDVVALNNKSIFVLFNLQEKSG